MNRILIATILAVMTVFQSVGLILIANYYIDIRDTKEDYLVKEVVHWRKISASRYKYAEDLEKICEMFYSSKKEKEKYHIRQGNFVPGYNQ